MKSENKFFFGVFGWIKIIFIVFIFVFGICYFLIFLVIVNGKLMDLIFYDGEYLFINKVLDLKCFDIIVFFVFDEENVEYIKCVIGFLGDKVEYKED